MHRAQLGLVAQTITSGMAEGLNLERIHRVIVSNVEPDRAADHGSIKADDIITAINGRSINNLHELESKISRLHPGTQVTLTVQRGENQLDLPVLAEERSGAELDALAELVDPEKNLDPQLGILGLDITKEVIKLLPDLRRPSGVVIAARRNDSSFSGADLQTGDAIYSVNRRVVETVQQLQDVMNSLKPG